MIFVLLFFFFFFQAEDGIRALYVTGVQTCALPILFGRHNRERRGNLDKLLLLSCAGRTLAQVRADCFASYERQFAVDQRGQLLYRRMSAHRATSFAIACRAAAIRERTVPIGTCCSEAISS